MNRAELIEKLMKWKNSRCHRWNGHANVADDNAEKQALAAILDEWESSLEEGRKSITQALAKNAGVPFVDAEYGEALAATSDDRFVEDNNTIAKPAPVVPTEIIPIPGEEYLMTVKVKIKDCGCCLVIQDPLLKQVFTIHELRGATFRKEEE